MLLISHLVFVFLSLRELHCSDSTEVQDLPDFQGEISSIKSLLREESLNLREEMYSLLGDKLKDGNCAMMTLPVMELMRELAQLKEMVTVQGLKAEVFKDLALERMDDVKSEVMAEITGLAGQVDEVKSGMSQEIGELKSGMSQEIGEVKLGLGSISRKVEVMRSEVRLISQHKLTWANHTYNDQYHSDFVVDGVYTMKDDHAGVNPIQCSGRGMNERNTVVIIDLGGLFKIHTVKLWNRLDGISSHALGVFVYADDILLGGIAEDKKLYNFVTDGDVFAKNIVIKQSLPKYLTFLEVQVFGSGPFAKEEIV